MKNLITLNDTEIRLVDRNGQHWFTAADLSKALGYQQADAISRIYRRHKDEFPADMSETVNLTVSGNLKRKTRIFSLRGAQLISMLAKTEKAKFFRKAVLDLIENEQASQKLEQARIEDKRRDEQLRLEDKRKKELVHFCRLSTPEAITPGDELATNFAAIRDVSSSEIGVQTETALHQFMVYVATLIRDNRQMQKDLDTLKAVFSTLQK